MWAEPHSFIHCLRKEGRRTGREETLKTSCPLLHYLPIHSHTFATASLLLHNAAFLRHSLAARRHSTAGTTRPYRYGTAARYRVQRPRGRRRLAHYVSRPGPPVRFVRAEKRALTLRAPYNTTFTFVPGVVLLPLPLPAFPPAVYPTGSPRLFAGRRCAQDGWRKELACLAGAEHFSRRNSTYALPRFNAFRVHTRCSFPIGRQRGSAAKLVGSLVINRWTISLVPYSSLPGTTPYLPPGRFAARTL